MLDETRHFYYTSGWQSIEERVGNSTDADRQFVWGRRYIDDLVLRDRDTSANGTLDERLYAMQDANWNVTAVADDGGTVQERYAYTAYGEPTYLDASYAARSSSSYAWGYLYTGRYLDSVSGLYYFRNRMYHAGLGRFVLRDRTGYSDGYSLYACYFAISGWDPSGLRGAPVRPSATPRPGTGGSAGTGSGGVLVPVNPGPWQPIPGGGIPFGPQFPNPTGWESTPVPTWPVDPWPGMPDDMDPGLYPAPGFPGYTEAVEECWERSRRRRRLQEPRWDPVTNPRPYYILTPVQPDPNPCRPCEETEGPLPPPETNYDHDHGRCEERTGSKTHWHYFTYDQDPVTCRCRLSRRFGGCGEAPQ